MRSQGIEVSVIDLNGTPFTEYGEQNLLRRTPGSKIACVKVEAKTGKAFNLMIKTEAPFPYDKDEPGKKGKMINIPTSQHFLRNKKEINDQPVLGKAVGEDAEMQSQTQGEGRKLRSAMKEPPPFQLAVYIYIDGNTKPESRSIIYLDPNDSKRWKPSTRLTGRWEVNIDPSEQCAETQPIRVLSWVFTPFGGLDYWLHKLDVNAADASIPATADEIEEDDVANMMKDNTIREESRPKKGVIRVVIKRIIVQGPVRPAFQANVYARSDREMENDPTAQADDWLTHETDVERTKAQDLRLHVMEWTPYRAGEKLFAEFQFQYMDRAKLVNMGLSKPDGTPIKGGARRAASDPVPCVKLSNKRGALDDDAEQGVPELPTKKSTAQHSEWSRTRVLARGKVEVRARIIEDKDQLRDPVQQEDADSSSEDDERE